MVFLFDDLDMRLGKSLEKAVGDKCYFYRQGINERFDFSVAVFEPAVCFNLGYNYPDDIKKHVRGMEYLRSIGIPVIIYSEISEEEWNKEGYIKGKAYDVYFNKYRDSFDDVSNKLMDYLEFSPRFQVN